MVRQSVAMGDTLVACFRTPTEAIDIMTLAREADRICVLGLDMRFEHHTKRISNEFGRSLDLLVCNAGVLNGRGGLSDPEQDSQASKYRLMTNVGGVFFADLNFLPHLRVGVEQRSDASSKLAIISSQIGSSRFGIGAIIYRASKAAVTNQARSLTVELASHNIAVDAYHSGWVQTDMVVQEAPVAPAKSAAGLMQRFTQLNLKTTGVFEDYRGAAFPF